MVAGVVVLWQRASESRGQGSVSALGPPAAQGHAGDYLYARTSDAGLAGRAPTLPAACARPPPGTSDGGVGLFPLDGGGAPLLFALLFPVTFVMSELASELPRVPLELAPSVSSPPMPCSLSFPFSLLLSR